MKRLNLELDVRFEDISYPTIIDYDMKFGDNFSEVLYSDRFTYSWKDENQQTVDEETRFVYAIALYANSYGLSDIRKPEFKIKIASSEAPQRVTSINEPLTTF